jgi:hypothetical protein
MTNGLVNSKFGANGGFGMSNIGNGNSNVGGGKMSNGIVGADFSGLTGLTGITVTDIGINNLNGKVNPNNNGQKNIQMPLDNFARENSNTGGYSVGSGLNGQSMSNFNPSQVDIDVIDQQIRELTEKKKLRMQQQNPNQNNQLFHQKKAQIAQLMKELAQFD